MRTVGVGIATAKRKTTKAFKILVISVILAIGSSVAGYFIYVHNQQSEAQQCAQFHNTLMSNLGAFNSSEQAEQLSNYHAMCG